MFYRAAFSPSGQRSGELAGVQHPAGRVRRDGGVGRVRAAGGVVDSRVGDGQGDRGIDLNSRNVAAFRRQLAPFIGRARRAGTGGRLRPARALSGRERSARIRAWAKDHGISVSDRGRIAASIIEQYDKAATAR